MCDTMSIVADYNDDRVTYFAKNSDRSPNEPHLILRIPAMKHEAGSEVRCTYISIPQVEYTREMILYKPSWIWGAEMGVNDARVAIGNEAVFTKAKRGAPALTGMDMLRLALERADTAASAVEVMIGLLETFGQGGNCGFDKEFFYDNSFLAADPKEAYVLETAGKNYAVTKVEGKYAISNRLSIGKSYSAASGVANGQDFARRFTEPVYSHFAAAKERRQQVMDCLSPAADAAGIMKIIRSHNANIQGREFTRGSVGSVCMHAGGIVGDHTTGSLVAILRQDKPITLWSTGSSTPCISSFKPVFWNSVAAPVFDEPAKSLEYWLRREHIHRAVIAGRISAGDLRGRIRDLETEWQAREEKLMSADKPDAAALAGLSADCDRQEQALVNEFYVENWREIECKNRYARYWAKKNNDLDAPLLR